MKLERDGVKGVDSLPLLLSQIIRPDNTPYVYVYNVYYVSIHPYLQVFLSQH